MESRIRRVAENEARFREINEDLRERLDGLALEDDDITFVCECGEVDCSDPVTLTLAGYEAVRADSTRFAVLPGHEKSDAEQVVERHAGYFVVCKAYPPGAEIARATDPRA